MTPNRGSVPGIAVITYRRPAYLAKCLERIRQHTKGRYELIVVCDSPDDKETEEVCRGFGVPMIKGENRGVVWNKNRGLYHFMTQTECDPILLLEDDTYPVSDSWLAEWTEAISRWHHVNYSYAALDLPPTRGSGTPRDPHIHRLVSGQCTGVSRYAMERGGYLDTGFKGYGHGHVEWTRRHLALLMNPIRRFLGFRTIFISIVGGLHAEDGPTFRNEEDVARNRELLERTARGPIRYRPAWRSDEEKAILLAEVRSPSRW